MYEKGAITRGRGVWRRGAEVDRIAKGGGAILCSAVAENTSDRTWRLAGCVFVG